MKSISDLFKGIIFRGLENTVGRYYSTYRAFVYNNEDPNGQNRLQLLVPHLNPNIPDETWAYPRNNFSGNGYGIHMIPKKGDMVWVEYEYGNLDYPVWSFGHYGEKEKPQEFIGDSIYGFKTPRGNIVIIDDNKDKESISIKLKGLNDLITINIDEIVMESKSIKIGKDASEWAAKGESTQNKIEEIWVAINSLNSAIASHTHTSGGPGSPTSPPITATNFTQGASDANSKKSKVKDILSGKVKIE